MHLFKKPLKCLASCYSCTPKSIKIAAFYTWCATQLAVVLIGIGQYLPALIASGVASAVALNYCNGDLDNHCIPLMYDHDPGYLTNTTTPALAVYGRIFGRGGLFYGGLYSLVMGLGTIIFTLAFVYRANQDEDCKRIDGVFKSISQTVCKIPDKWYNCSKWSMLIACSLLPITLIITVGSIGLSFFVSWIICTPSLHYSYAGSSHLSMGDSPMACSNYGNGWENDALVDMQTLSSIVFRYFLAINLSVGLIINTVFVLLSPSLPTIWALLTQCNEKIQGKIKSQFLSEGLIQAADEETPLIDQHGLT